MHLHARMGERVGGDAVDADGDGDRLLVQMQQREREERQRREHQKRERMRRERRGRGGKAGGRGGAEEEVPGEKEREGVRKARLEQHLRELAKGAELLVSGETTQNVVMPAHLVDKVTPEMKLFRDESFGPVVGIARARDEAHAIELANDTEYGLSSAVFTRDTARGLKVARQIQAGICHVNASTVSDEPQMPFGGMKASGYGRFGGKAGIDAFTELRWITFETEPGHYPI